VRAKHSTESQMPFCCPDFDRLTSDLSDAGYRFLEMRGFSKKVVDQNEIRSAFKSFKVGGEFVTKECIAIPYKREGDVVSIKYRAIEGLF
jgi:hypothetical protein